MAKYLSCRALAMVLLFLGYRVAFAGESFGAAKEICGVLTIGDGYPEQI
ncbi:MAG: hypothetical protein L3J33_08750 [Rhodobacteraceae bacterium]|nr:hypothetical protein [Paracoccaceae bacterium]